MTRKYLFSVLVLLMLFSCIQVHAKSEEPYIMDKNKQEFINVEFDDSFFTPELSI